ncbi:MAG: hypothetical protein WKF30_15610 [Pyrinomonadaceae bacterium]
MNNVFYLFYLSATGRKVAQHIPGVDTKVLEKQAIWAALRNAQVFKEPDKAAYYFFYKCDQVIGYNEGQPTRWLRVEVTASWTPVYHGHPANLKQVRKGIPNAEE